MLKVYWFADTVNVAKLMEGTGEAMRVQASDDIKSILDTFGTFEFEQRGLVPGHNGAVTAWWLTGERHTPDLNLQDAASATNVAMKTQADVLNVHE